MSETTRQWFHVLDKDELPEGRVKTVTAGHKSIAMTHYNGQYGALDNRCPHQGGPLGEGSIENGYLRCPWHGWEFDILNGRTIFKSKMRVKTYEVHVETDLAEDEIDGVETYPVTVEDGLVILEY